MIDKRIFLEEIAVLMDWFNRNFEEPTLNRLHQRLSQHLSTQQFQSAALKVFDSAKFFPTVEDFVSAAKGSNDMLAQEEWEKCLAAAARGESANALGLSPQGQFALRSIGGVYQLGLTEESKHDWKRKEFVSAWKSYAPSPYPAVASGQQEISLQKPDAEFAARLEELSRRTDMNGNGRNHR